MTRSSRIIKLAVQSLRPPVARELLSHWRPSSEVETAPSGAHLDATIDWLCRAQDACGDGVSAGYSLWGGWLPAYPETTGYIIPTFFDYAAVGAREELRARARRMADWEITVQLPDGAVRSGAHGDSAAEARPAVFNTGQVILGWDRAYRELSDGRYLDAAVRAGDWLVREQGDDGAWRGHSPETGTAAHAYDSRTAWSLLLLHEASGLARFEDAAHRQLRWVLLQQRPNGWFQNNAFYSGEHRWSQPFTHTIAYVLEGLLESWRIAGERAYLDAVVRTADQVVDLVRPDGFLSGHFDENWRGDDRYCCLTGSAQLAGVFMQLFREGGDQRYGLAAKRLLSYLKRHHSLTSSDPGIRGGVKGSQPVWGRYTPFVYINWGAKFFADALLLEREIEESR